MTINPATLAAIEAVIDTAGVAGRIEARLPVGPRPRQLAVRTLLIGMCAAAADGRPGHLCRVHQALVALNEIDRARLGVTATWKTGPHVLTYRQTEYTFGRVAAALSKPTPDGAPTDIVSAVVDDLLEASIPEHYKTVSTSLAVDWTDHESFSRSPDTPTGPAADREACWGHRRGNAPGQKHETFYGYYLSHAVTVSDEGADPVPELIRRATLTSCHHDPVPALVPVLRRLADTTATPGDILADTGYAHRIPQNWALPLRAVGYRIITDLHPHDRGPHGTWAGAIAANGNLYCPATPTPLLNLTPLPKGPSAKQIQAHDRQTSEAARHKLAPIGTDDPDGYHRVTCPAAAGKIRCPHRPESMTLGYNRPTITAPPDPPPQCCTQKTVTVPPTVNAKTRQKHDYPGPAWRASYTRRTAVERSYATLKDPATNNIGRGWCRLMGLTPILLFLTTTIIIRNQRVANNFTATTPSNTRRRPKRRTPITTLAAHPDP